MSEENSVLSLQSQVTFAYFWQVPKGEFYVEGTVIESQFDEIEVLRSIYGDVWKTDENTSGSYSIDIEENGITVSLFISLPETYPLQSPPVYTLSAPNLSKHHKDLISNLLNNEYLENIGESVLYQWIEKIREYLLEIKAGDDESRENSVENLEESSEVDLIVSDDIPPILHGEVICDRKSSFQAHLAQVHSVQQVRLALEALKANKKVANATHNMFAYRISLGNSSFVQDCFDDGETQAGSRLLHLLQIVNVSDVLVVVSRWYGGIHLGSDRFRHINNAARQVLVSAQLLSPTAKRV